MHVAGFFSPTEKVLTIQAYNSGDVSANLASHIRCFFGLEDAMRTALGHNVGEVGGIEVEFWARQDRVLDQHESAKVEYDAQFVDFDAGDRQVLCFSALNYLANNAYTEDFFALDSSQLKSCVVAS